MPLEQKHLLIQNEEAFFKQIKNPFLLRLFLLQKLPAAYFSGLKILRADAEASTVSVPYKWFTRNPFFCTYFACLAMAAEMSTGLLAMGAIYKRKPQVSMLIVSMESKYYKKATDTTYFTCKDGNLIYATINETIQTGMPQTFKAEAEGYNKNGELIAQFWFTWSFKVKSTGKNVIT